MTRQPERRRLRLKSRDDGWGKLTRGAPLAVLVGVALIILYKLLPVLELIAVAALVGLVFRTTLRWLKKLVKLQWLAVLILVGIVIGFILFLVFVLFPSLFDEARILSSTLPKYLNSLVVLSQTLHTRASFVPDLSQGLEQLKSVIDHIVSLLPLFLRNTVELSIETIATLILALYMAYDPNSLIQGTLRLAPRKHRPRILKLLGDIKDRLQGWIFGTGLAILIIGFGAFIGLSLLRIPLAISFGFLAGVLAVIPYVGSIVGALLPALVALTISPLKALLVLVLFLIINQADAHIIQPLIMAERVRLHPVMVVLAFLVMGKLIGILGVLLAVPAAAVLGSIIDEFTTKTEIGEARE